MMKKLITTVILFAFFVFPHSVSAQTPAQDNQVVNSKFLQQVNPLTVVGNKMSGVPFEVQQVMNIANFSTPAGFLNAVLPWLFSLAGVILFIMITWGGFEMMMGASDTKSFDAGKQRVTSALIGFTLLFCSYWIAQIIQYIFGVNILG